MPQVRVKGVQNAMQFPDDMDINDIRGFLQRKFTQQAVAGTNPVELGNRPEQMQGVDESVSQKIARGVSDTLLNTGLISNNQDAYRIGGNVGALAEMAPGVGDLVDVDDFGRAAATGDALGMVTSSLGAIPVLGGLAKSVASKMPMDAIRRMTKDEFLGSPSIVSPKDAADLNPRDYTKNAKLQPFKDNLQMKMDDSGIAVYDGDNLVASYMLGRNLVVDKKYRKKGIGEELVYQYRTAFPSAAKAETRTKASQKIQENVWDRIQREINE